MHAYKHNLTPNDAPVTQITTFEKYQMSKNKYDCYLSVKCVSKQTEKCIDMTEINTCDQGSLFVNDLHTVWLTMNRKTDDFDNVRLTKLNVLFLKQKHKIIRTKTSRDVLCTTTTDTANSNKTQ